MPDIAFHSQFFYHARSHIYILLKNGQGLEENEVYKGEKCVILAEVQFEARGLQCAEDKIASLPNAYNRFKKWCAEKNVQVYSENVLLAYFSENAKNNKSSTLWAQYSMVKSCLIIYDNIDISKFPKLIAFLKRTGDGYQAKKY
ncbi:hypothetical protein NQ317_017323 [Molorchus minor]|uniref:Uncharacterized protein n=1 Tax=Molorchus minor TaxID=1323400 RepID=A0ABQ9K2M9_9CUCU|nr:hypothetical protein NQ317_017323 [Molorchus minor]